MKDSNFLKVILEVDKPIRWTHLQIRKKVIFGNSNKGDAIEYQIKCNDSITRSKEDKRRGIASNPMKVHERR